VSKFTNGAGLQTKVVKWLKRALVAYIWLVFLAVGSLLAHTLHWPFPLVMVLWAPLACVVAILLVLGGIWALVMSLPSKTVPPSEKSIKAEAEPPSA